LSTSLRQSSRNELCDAEMRFVVFGAGAIGGLVGARLFEAGEDVTLIARGAQFAALKKEGLFLWSPSASPVRLHPRVVADPLGVTWSDDVVVLLAVKSEDTGLALRQLVTVAPATTLVACMQNGVENERQALRFFQRTYGMCVLCPASHLSPGVIDVRCSPGNGIVDIGRYLSGVDDGALTIAAALVHSGFSSTARPDIMRWKYRKLLVNLVNAIEALVGPAHRESRLAQEAINEGRTVLSAAGIDFAGDKEYDDRRVEGFLGSTVWSEETAGGSSWQSLMRKTGSSEAPYLNGEIAMLGAHLGLATPVNSLLQREALKAAHAKLPPGTWRLGDLSRAAGLPYP
jgi:2-dehydropantoate 2-reductase